MTKPQEWIHMRSIKSLQKKQNTLNITFWKNAILPSSKDSVPPSPTLKKFMEILLLQPIKIGS